MANKKTTKKLTDKQRAFIQEYLVDLNATQAAIRAGYSTKTANIIGPENLVKPCIQAEIFKAMDERAKNTGVTAERVIKELALIGFADMADFITINEEGLIRAFPLTNLSEGKSRIVRKVKERRTIRKDKDGTEIIESFYEFELYDKLKSLELLSRHLGILDGQLEGENPSDAARQMREAALEMRGVTNVTG